MKDDNSQLTSGQARRLAKKQAAIHANRTAKRNRIIGIVSGIVVMVAIVAIIGVSVGIKIHDSIEEARLQASLIPVVEDYSAGLDENGFVEGVNAEDYISIDLEKLKNIEIEYSDIEYSDDDVESDIETLLSENSTDDMTYDEFDDLFVKNVLGENLTAEEYKAKIKADKEKENTLEAINSYILDIVEIKGMPEEYRTTMAGIIKYMNNINLEYINAMYESLGYESSTYDDIYDYMGKTVSEYEEYVTEEAEESIVSLLVYEILYTNYGLDITDDEYTAYLTENEIDDESYFGKPYILGTMIGEEVREYLFENAVTYNYNTIEDTGDEYDVEVE